MTNRAVVPVGRNLEAESQYRAAWTSYVLTRDPGERRSLEVLMDFLQPSIAYSPKDPRWGAFADSLPGYREHWARLSSEFNAMVDQLEGRNPGSQA